MQDINIIIITGLSGSGKSTAIASLEDAGYYCVDNMPVALLPKFLELPVEDVSRVYGYAFVMDLREKDFLPQYRSVFESIRQKGVKFRILFLEASDETLLKRYSQTRRHHPLSTDKNLPDGIHAEREQLKDLRKAANKIIDTSHFNVHELKAVISDFAQKTGKANVMRLNILSFGFKFGVPLEADLMMDVRFLINPYFVPELKAMNGEDTKVKKYVLNNRKTRRFLKKFIDLLDYLIPLYKKEGKSYLSIAVGCTGGRHRSVAVARYIYDYLQKPGEQVEITHRDIDQ